MAKGKRESANEISDEKVAKIRADIAEWEPGLWAQQIAYGPACACGLSDRYIQGNRGYSKHGIPTKECQRHRE